MNLRFYGCSNFQTKVKIFLPPGRPQLTSTWAQVLTPSLNLLPTSHMLDNTSAAAPPVESMLMQQRISSHTGLQPDNICHHTSHYKTVYQQSLEAVSCAQLERIKTQCRIAAQS